MAHGPEASHSPAADTHSHQNTTGVGFIKAVGDAVYKTIDGIIEPVVKLPEEAIAGVGEVVDQAARLGLKKSGGGGGGEVHP